MGLRAIRLREGDEVVGMEVCREGHDLLVATEKGYGKRTPLEEYRVRKRRGLAIKTLDVTAKNGPLVDMKVVEPDDELLLITAEGQIIRQPVAPIRQTGRSAQGVRLIRLDAGDRVAGMTRVVKREEPETDDSAGPEHSDAESPQARANVAQPPSAVSGAVLQTARKAPRGKAAPAKGAQARKPAARTSKKPTGAKAPKATKPAPRVSVAAAKQRAAKSGKRAGKQAAKAATPAPRRRAR